MPTPHTEPAAVLEDRSAPIKPAPRGRNPYDTTGVRRGPDGSADYDDLPRSLVEMLASSVERDPDAVALVEVGGGSGSLTYRELWERAARVAGGLRAGGVRRGDRAAIRMPNGIDWVLAFFGCHLAGAVVVPINTRLTDEEAGYVVRDSGSVLTFSAMQPLPDAGPFAIDDTGPDDLATIFYTSGTTGFPKGAMLTHRNLLANAENGIRCHHIKRSDGPELSTLIGVPLFHVTACNMQLIPLLDIGGRVELLSNPLDFEGFFEAVGNHGVSGIVAVPAIYYALLRAPGFSELDVSRVQRVSYGGAPIAAGLVREIQAAFPDSRVGNGFGLTECSGLASYLPHEEAAAHADSVGFAPPTVDLAVAHADPESGVGELLVRGPNVAAGYWDNAEATEETFVAGWLHTGDVGRVDADGLLYVLDRKKDMINRGGENVYSLEVESVLAGAPGVAEVALLPVPDDMMGEKVGAVVVPLAGKQVDVSAVVGHCAEHLADFKVPQYVVVREQPLPRSTVGKVLKGRLREQTGWGAPAR
ncbi:MAG TPA: AMP-binding protein [Solirubrobacteraceae bacterium]|nr:AMP-binding protein [Solirubrobacteraceae bacterium]